MITLFSVLLCVAAAAYCCGLLAVAAGVRRVFTEVSRSQIAAPTVSVIVAARDEATNIESCLRSILDVEYPPNRLELIVVDDHSSDGTSEIVASLFDQTRRRRTAPTTHLLRSGHGSGGKQHALDLGIRAASGEIILTTDADCAVSRQWIRSMIRRFDDRTGFVAGPVAYTDPPNLVSRAEAIDFLALVAVGAGTIGLGSPTICNSANAAYRRDLYFRYRLQSEEVHEAAADETLMHFVHSETEHEVVFCSSRDALVMTSGSNSIHDFFSRRARWAASTSHLVSGAGLLVLAAAFVFFGMMIVGFIGGLASADIAVAFGIALVLKTAGDAAVVYPFARRLDLPRSLTAFCVAEVLHAPTVIVAVMMASLGNVVWKGRPVQRYAEVAAHPGVRNLS